VFRFLSPVIKPSLGLSNHQSKRGARAAGWTIRLIRAAHRTGADFAAILECGHCGRPFQGQGCSARAKSSPFFRMTIVAHEMRVRLSPKSRIDRTVTSQ
jgi:hypothetical protein